MCLTTYLFLIFVKNRDYEPAHNIAFFIPLLPFPFSPRYHSQHPNFKHPQPMFLLMRDQVLHPYKTTLKVIVACILMFTFLGSNLHSRWFWTKWQQAFPKCTLLLLISFWMKFWYVGFIYKHMNFFSELPKDLLHVFVYCVHETETYFQLSQHLLLELKLMLCMFWPRKLTLSA